ncbi:hypothetical protein FRC11_007286 [Ceratobasidium sp. 423]|nr:hypothetical protein FRC11_007286 [Ceratobasidium sp. 423]
MSEHLLPVISDQLKALRDVLERLPPKHQSAGSTYPFENFTLDEEWLELTGSAQGSVNHTLEVTFGSQHHGQPLVFTSHGPDLVAVVDVLSTHITGLNGENPILIQWIDDLQAAATHALEQDPSPDSVKHDRKPMAKQEILNQDASKKNDKAKKAAVKARAKKAKKRMEEEFLWDLLDLRPARRSDNPCGRKPDPLLDQSTEFVKSISDPEVKCWQCSASAAGCAHSQADPRSSLRVLGHAVECSYLSPELVERAAEACIAQSLGAQIETLNVAKASGNVSKSGDKSTQPSIYATASAAGRDQCNLKFNYLILQAFCMLSLPPAIIDTPSWKCLIQFLDPLLDFKSGSHLATALIPAKAARIRQLSIQVLRKHRDCTISFDRATSRHNQSIYTVHVTTPDTCDAHLMCGHSATGKSHTGEHLKDMLLKCINAIGAEHISAISSDSTGNTRLVQKPRIVPTLRFRNMSNMFKSSGKVSVDLRGVGAGSATSCVNVVTATDSSAEDEDTEAPGLSAEEWECEAGFDEVIEWVEAGSKDAFEVDGINLSDPLLLDLLSDEPIPGAITRGSTSAQKRSAPTDVGLLMAEGSRKKLAPESFQF